MRGAVSGSGEVSSQLESSKTDAARRSLAAAVSQRPRAWHIRLLLWVHVASTLGFLLI